MDRLAPFGDSEERDTPDRDRFQAIVPAYTFQCSGRVTEWRACVQRGGGGERYYIEFQVWRRTGSTDGCYELVGTNTPQDTTETEDMDEERSGSRSGESNNEVLLSPQGGGGSDPLDHCVVLPVREDRQIEFQSGDVVGYYVDNKGDDQNDNDDGIQWIVDHDNVVVRYRDNLRRNDMQSYYAINGPNPTECGFPISGDSNLYTLADSRSAAPIIDVSISTALLTLSSTQPILSPPPSLPLPPGPAAVVSTATSLTSSLTSSLSPSPSTGPPPLVSPAPTGDQGRDVIIVAVIFVIIILFLGKLQANVTQLQHDTERYSLSLQLLLLLVYSLHC